MTFQRLISDLQDAWRQAMADGPRGTGQRGWFRVQRERDRWVVIFLTSAVRGADGLVARTFEGMALYLDADLSGGFAADVAWQLVQRARESRIEKVAS